MNSEVQNRMLICHSVPGRLRVKMKYLFGARRKSQMLKHRLQSHANIRYVKLRFNTGSIIVGYDSQVLSRDDILKLLQSLWESLPPVTQDMPVSPYRKTEVLGPSVFYLVHAIFLGGFLFYVLLRSFLRQSPLSQKPFSLTGIVAIISAIPLFKNSISEALKKKRIGLFPFLTAACMLAIFIGEALTAIEIIWLATIGIFLEKRAMETARRSIQETLLVAPATTLVLVSGSEVEMRVADVQAGDIVLVRTGDRISVDGRVELGEALVNESQLTGRVFPERRQPHDWVYAGTLVEEGELRVLAEKTGKDAYLYRIRDLVENALATHTQSEKKADILAKRLTWLGLIATSTTLFLTGSITRALTVMLVMACPCATVLAASTAVGAAISNAFRHQILIKSGQYLEIISQIDCFCFDKTGTITSGQPTVADVVPRLPGQSKDRLVELAARAEKQSLHPLAQAMIKEAQRRGLNMKGQNATDIVVGRGVRAELDGNAIIVGNKGFMEAENVNPAFFNGKAQDYLKKGCTVIYVARNGELQGMIAVADTLRPGAVNLVNLLHAKGVPDIHLISGDMEPVVKSLAEALKFDCYQAELLPEAKAAYVEKLKAEGKKVLMIGDGVNDALALAKASVGIAMGHGGAEVALEAADIALLKDNLTELLFLRALSQKTMNTI
ncbi:MAG: cation-translocating P-type ATPase, partial [Desulfobacteraceae bacterium]